MADSFNPTDLNVPNYRLIKPIGQGAFGQVWLAEEELTRIYCAVKIIPGAGSKKQGVELTGVQTYRRLSQGHPNLIQLSAPPGMDGDCLYYVMELADNALGTRVAAETDYQPMALATLLTREQRLPIDTALDHTHAILAGVDHLHRNGLRHRDLKPSNVLFVDGVLKLADIGLASRETTSFVGTPGYRTPEGESDDLYAVGIMLYEMITGQPPSRFPELPADLDRTHDPKQLKKVVHLFNRACDPNRSNRFESANEFRHAVLRIRDVQKAGGKTKKTVALVAAVVLVLAGILWQAVNPKTGLEWFDLEFVPTQPNERIYFPPGDGIWHASWFQVNMEWLLYRDGLLKLSGAFYAGFDKKAPEDADPIITLSLALDNKITHLIYCDKPGRAGQERTFTERRFPLKDEMLTQIAEKQPHPVYAVLLNTDNYFQLVHEYEYEKTGKDRNLRVLIGHIQRRE